MPYEAIVQPLHLFRAFLAQKTADCTFLRTCSKLRSSKRSVFPSGYCRLWSL